MKSSIGIAIQLLALATQLLLTPSALGEEAGNDELEKIKQRYWAQGNEREMGVVQNRLYTKENRLETTLMGGFLASDPFLQVNPVGASIGWHFDETFSAHAFGWKSIVNSSTALLKLQEGGKEANTNPPSASAGLEARASVLYGKLSLVGKKILYYDMHAGLGAAATRTETGSYFGPLLSVGQNYYLSQLGGAARAVSFRVDYRLMAYHENLVEKQITEKKGQIIGSRNNFSHAITFGFSIFWGGN